jgi:hypothetical protein
MSPIALLFQSRKFLILLVDAVVSIVSLLLARFLSPDDVKFVLAIIAILQPVIYAVIAGIAKEDAAVKAINGEVLKSPKG